MYYSPETVVELERGQQVFLGELEDIWLPLARDLVRSLTNERAQEYLVHRNVFNLIPRSLGNKGRLHNYIGG